MYVTAAIIADAERVYGAPREIRATYEITSGELAMIRASQRDQRAHDATVFVFDGDRLAVIAKPSYPSGAYRVPGGALQRGEAMHTGAAREALEETGLNVRLERYVLRIYARFTVGDDVVDWTTHVVTARPVEPVPDVSAAALTPPDTREIREARWSTLEELNGPIRDVLRGSGRPLFRYRSDLHHWASEELSSRKAPGPADKPLRR